jgi:hypothetical protein
MLFSLIDQGCSKTSADVTFSLKIWQSNTGWTGTGPYFVMLHIINGQNHVTYAYTEGKTFQELGITSQQDIVKLPKYNISKTTSSIDFGQFVQAGGGN